MDNNIYNPDYVKGLFNKMSSSYERMNYITSFGFSIRWRKQFLSDFKASSERVEVIDILTGMGETWPALKRKLPNAAITALDFADEMLACAKRNNKSGFDSSITLIQQDILQNSLPGNHFDFVTCAFGLKTFDKVQLRILADEVKRILKPGGRFSFVEVSKPENKILSTLYGFYLGSVIPILGRYLLGHSFEYKMLWRYTIKFVNAKVTYEVFKDAGLRSLKYKSYFLGCATGFTGQK
jgi:ubiquinone/menaquinone biosynthesis methyltransferase